MFAGLPGAARGRGVRERTHLSHEWKSFRNGL
jgi:hypothetical protein